MNSKARALLLAVTLFCGSAISQEWTKQDSGREEYVRDRSDCAQQAQKMALVGEELQRDVAECLATKGWQRNKVDVILDMHCEEKETVKACKRGGTADIYNKERAECVDQMLRTVGNTYSRPAWFGLGGLIASTAQAEENKRNLQRTQITTIKICMEGRGWSMELRGAAAKAMEQDRQDQPPTDRTRP